MKAERHSKASNLVRRIKNTEDRMIQILDRRRKTGKDNEDECAKRMTVSEDGSRCWSY